MERNIAEIKDWARGLMNRLMTNETFAKSMADTHAYTRRQVKCDVMNMFSDITVEYGATRLIIIQDDVPYVLKIQYDNSRLIKSHGSIH